MRKEVKKIMAATLSLAMLMGVGNTVDSSAANALNKKAFSFNVESNHGRNHTKESMKRTAKATDNAWMVDFRASNETSSGNTATIFYLGIVKKNANNGYGSAYRTVKEGSGPKYFSPYDTTYNKDIVLYAMDNKDGTTNGYSISGYWNAQSGHKPVDDN